MSLTALLSNLKRTPDSRMFKDLMTLLEFRMDTIMAQLIISADTEETLRLQGRAREISELISGLTRKPIQKDDFKSGGFN